MRLRIAACAVLIMAFALTTNQAHAGVQVVVSYAVNSPADTHDSATALAHTPYPLCMDASGKCTVRAAVEAANAVTPPAGDTARVNIEDPGYHTVLLAGYGTLLVNNTNGQVVDTHLIGLVGTVPILDANHGVFSIITVDTQTEVWGFTLENSGSGGGSYNGGGVKQNAAVPVGVDHVTFLNNNVGTGYGGGLYADYFSSVSITNSAFTGNVAGESGGALYNGDATVSIVNTTFTNNTANNTSGEGGAIYNDEYMSIARSTFTGNVAGGASAAAVLAAGNGYGGAIYNSYSLSLSYSRVANNTAGDSGGGLYNSDDITASTVTFSGNQTEYDGGGIYSDSDASFTNLIIINNKALYLGDSYGGGVYEDSSGSYTGGYIRGNYSGYEGGGMYTDSEVHVSRVLITQNFAEEYGGGIANESDSDLSEVAINSNKAGGGVYGQNGYGGGLYNSSQQSISDSQFNGNSVWNGGVGIPGTQPKVVPSACSIFGIGAEGGAIYETSYYYYGSYGLPIAHTTFSNNYSQCNAGAIYAGLLGSSHPLSLATSVVWGNKAENNGGAFYLASSGDVVDLQDTRVNSNSAGNRTGGIYNFALGDFLLSGTTNVSLNTDSAGCPNTWLPCG